MRRREFIEAVIGATSATLWPLRAGAENALPVIGVLGTSGATDYNPMIAAFRKGLSEAGYVEGKNVSFDYLWADNHYDRLPELASELVRRRVQLILAAATPAALAIRSVNTNVPVVLPLAATP